jgi:hypothetical protein
MLLVIFVQLVVIVIWVQDLLKIVLQVLIVIRLELNQNLDVRHVTLVNIVWEQVCLILMEVVKLVTTAHLDPIIHKLIRLNQDIFH